MIGAFVPSNEGMVRFVGNGYVGYVGGYGRCTGVCGVTVDGVTFVITRARCSLIT